MCYIFISVWNGVRWAEVLYANEESVLSTDEKCCRNRGLIQLNEAAIKMMCLDVSTQCFQWYTCMNAWFSVIHTCINTHMYKYLSFHQCGYPLAPSQKRNPSFVRPLRLSTMVVVWGFLPYVYINSLYFINISCVFAGSSHRHFWNDCYNI